MYLEIDSELAEPIYLQIYESIKTKIVAKELHAGEKLPSIRFLASELSVSRHTVDIAYQHLLAEGYIESKPRSGLVVSPLEDVYTTNKISSVSFEKEEETVTHDFYYGAIDLQLFPHRVWQRCLKNAMEDDPSILLYGDAQGDELLREEIVKYVAKSRGIQCTKDQVFICNGTQAATALIIQILQLSNQRVAFENPGYNEVRNTFEAFHCEVHPISVEEDGLSIEEVRQSRAKVAYVTPSHQFPLGNVLSIQKRHSLLNWANEYNAFLIEDDYNSEFRYSGNPITSLKSLDHNDRVIYFGTFSKCFLPSARCSYIILPVSLLRKANDFISQQTQNCSPIIQRAIALFMNLGYFEKHIRRMKVAYRKKHTLLNQCIQTYLGDQVKMVGQAGGLYIIMQPTKQSAQQFIDIAKMAGVKVYETDKYVVGIRSPYIMLGFGGLTEDEIRNGIELISVKLESFMMK